MNDLEKLMFDINTGNIKNGYIVLCEYIPLTFEIMRHRNEKMFFNPKSISIEKAYVFDTRYDAEKVAKTVRNGNGTEGNVEKFNKAVFRKIESIRELINLMR